MPTRGGNTQKQMAVILKAKDQTTMAWKSMKRTGKETLKALKQGYTALTAAVLAFATAILASGVVALKKMIDVAKDLAIGAVDTAAKFEMLEIQFEVMLGSVEVGKKVFDDLWAVAQRIPFTIEDIAVSARTLKAWGVLGRDIEGAMVAVADASALAGQKMDVMATIIGRAWQQGRFLTRGPGALLAGVMKTKQGFDITKMSIVEFRKALADLLTNPQFGISGMSQKLATTFIGIKSMIDDAITNIKITIARSGLFDTVKGFAEDIRQWLRSKPILKRMNQLGRTITNVVSDVQRKFNEMVKVGDMDRLIKDWLRIIRIVGKVISNIASKAPEIATIMMNFAEGIALAVEKIAKVVAALIPKIGLITGEVGTLEYKSVAATRAWEKQVKITEKWTKVLEDAKMFSQQGLQFTSKIWREARKGIAEMVRGDKDLLEDFKLIDIIAKRIGRATGKDKAAIQITVRTQMLELIEKIRDRESGIEDSLKAQLETLHEQLSAWQDNSVTTGGLIGTLNTLKQQILDMRDNSRLLVSDWKAWKGIISESIPEFGVLADAVTNTAKSVGKAWGNVFNRLIGRTEDVAEAFDVGTDPNRTLGERWSRALDDLVDRWAKTNADMADVARRFAEASAKFFEDFFFDLLTEGFIDMKKLLDSFLRDMARAISQAISQQIVGSMIGMAPSPTGTGAGGAGAGAGAGTPPPPIAPTVGRMSPQSRLSSSVARADMSGASGNTYTVINNIDAMDGADAYRTFTKNQDAMVAALREASMNGGRRSMRGSL